MRGDKVSGVFLASFRAGPWQTNCYLVAPERGSDVVVVDPGVQAFEPIVEATDAEGVGVAGVLLTHGHIDHVACAADVADHWGVPAWLHVSDRELLSDAGPGLPSSLELAQQLGVRLREPKRLRLLAGGETLSVGGLTFDVIAAPGHRPGCVMFSTPYDAEGEPTASHLLFSGDVLFAGSIGRTDLPGGNPAAMARTLRDVVLALPDDWVVLSGHGPETTIGDERATNPFLQDRFLRTL